MMNRIRVVLLIVVVFTLISLAHPVLGRTDQIIIENADESKTVSVAGSTQLEQYMGYVSEHFVMQSADDNTFYEVDPIPGTLEGLLDGISDRFVFENADGNEVFEIIYPLELIDDNTPPAIGNISPAIRDSSIVVISWTTDEFAIGELSFGAKSGDYSDTISDPLYKKEHIYTLSDLSVGTTYYYKITCTDRSGNTTSTGEKSFDFSAQEFLFLPNLYR
jgi:hypothetical protein